MINQSKKNRQSYGNYERDRMFYSANNRLTYTRVATITSKLLKFYLKETYDPRSVSFDDEIAIRGLVCHFVGLKVKSKNREYDYSFIDTQLKDFIEDVFETKIDPSISLTFCMR